MTIGSAAPMPFTGVRAPALRRAARPSGTRRSRSSRPRSRGLARGRGANEWEADNGILRNRKSGGNLVTDAKFTDFKLHVEFRYQAAATAASTCAAATKSRCSIQETSSRSAASARSTVTSNRPTRSAKKPGEWQTFDITLVGRMVTVVLNGTTIIANREIPGPTGAALDSDEGAPGPAAAPGRSHGDRVPQHHDRARQVDRPFRLKAEATGEQTCSFRLKRKLQEYRLVASAFRRESSSACP
jgi:hypothetical protein